MPEMRWNRRRFLQVAGGAAASVGAAHKAMGKPAATLAIAADPTDMVAASQPAAWAIQHLTNALETRGVGVRRVERQEQGPEDALCILAAGAESRAAVSMLHAARMTVAEKPEALAIVSAQSGSRRTVLACGRDARGLVYALTELADRVENAPDALEALVLTETIAEEPANEVRSWSRLFTSEVEDKPWYNDRAMWPRYFDMLATQRFNRFNLGFGIGYDFLRGVTDAYFLFTYPFLLDVPGYKVRVPQLPEAERENNLAMLQSIGQQCVARGIEFHIGLWMHGYVWMDSPHANYTVEGLDAATHGPYCRDALRLLLQKVPEISGVTFRIHGESGVPEGSFDFWKTVFDGAVTCGRTVAIDMHTKGMSKPMIQVALDTGMPVSMSPKFWAEHLGMTYHQADIRKIEKPRTVNRPGLMALSEGTRSFLRYGYGDLMTEDRKWSIVHRIWSGTQRVLLWGDPQFAAAYSRAFRFCGSNGVEIQEPLSFKGRRGSGIAGSRCGYADAAYDPRWDWEKYSYGTRVWGRLLYNPETRPEVWQRMLRRQFGPGAADAEAALGHASRILPTVTTSYMPSAANNNYWPEMYTNQSLVDAEHFRPYSDTLPPRVFGNASPLDPELFLSMDECAEELLAGRPSGKYTPLDVAQWLEEFTTEGRAALARAQSVSTGRSAAAYKRMRVDVDIQAGIGGFFGAKMRAGVLFHLYQKTQQRTALEAAVGEYRRARAEWARAAEAAKGVYKTDVTVGPDPQLRGHWLDRLTAIDQDITDVEALLDSATSGAASPQVAAAIAAAQARPRRVELDVQHTPPERFKRGAALDVRLTAPVHVRSAMLHYRHVDQAEFYESVAMERRGGGFAATIPEAYTQTDFPLEYYFTAATETGQAGLYPGLGRKLTQQPYFVVQSV